MSNLVITDTDSKSRTKYVRLDKDLEQMLIGAERYACGRRTYIVGDTVNYILALMPELSDWCLKIMWNDINEEFAMASRLGSSKMLGDECDIRYWDLFATKLEKELRGRGVL